MSCDYAELLALQTSQLSNLVSDLDQQLKKFQLLPTKVQEAIDDLSDLQVSSHLENNHTVRYNEPQCPPPRDGSSAADHLEVHFDAKWSHDPTLSGPSGAGTKKVRGTIADMLYQAQAECHSVRFPLKNKSETTWHQNALPSDQQQGFHHVEVDTGVRCIEQYDCSPNDERFEDQTDRR